MALKIRKAGAPTAPPAGHVFREFAWNLAGTLVRKPAPQKPRPAARAAGK